MAKRNRKSKRIVEKKFEESKDARRKTIARKRQLENETQRSEKAIRWITTDGQLRDIDHVVQLLLGYGLLNSLVGGGECYNTTCSTSWLVVSPLIPLGESGDVALKSTHLSGQRAAPA